MAKTGLFFGSFNPIHVGHLALADHLMFEFNLDEIWFVVSPHNPLKKRSTLLDGRQRLHMVNLAIENHDGFRSSDIEFYLPTPPYTADTLSYLEEKHPGHDFHLIMGEDSYNSLPKWKNFETLLEKYKLIVYPRIGDAVTVNEELRAEGSILFSNSPVLQVSSSFIRKQIKAGRFPRYLMPPSVSEYLIETGFYR